MTEPLEPESERPSSPGPIPPAGIPEPERGERAAPHPVADPYVARRVAEHMAAQAEAEQAVVTGPGAPQSAMTFYILLGIVISILLLIVIFQTTGPPTEPVPAPQRSLTSPG